MHEVLKDLGLHRLWVVYPGQSGYPLSERMDVVPLAQVDTLVDNHRLSQP